jgi:hypothetical protein
VLVGEGVGAVHKLDAGALQAQSQLIVLVAVDLERFVKPAYAQQQIARGGEISGVGISKSKPVSGLRESLQPRAESPGHVPYERRRSWANHDGGGANHGSERGTLMGGGMRRQETGRRFHIVVEQNDEIA